VGDSLGDNIHASIYKRSTKEGIMKGAYLVLLLIGIALFYLGCSDDGPTMADLQKGDQLIESDGIQVEQTAGTVAKKPQPTLIGKMYIKFVGPGPIPWDGQVDFEGYGWYGLRFYNLSGPPRDFSQASPFEEYFEFYDLGDPTVVYMAGTDAGVVSYANSLARANGKIEVANPPFEKWLDRNAQFRVSISWKTLPNGVVMPDSSLGTFRLN